jgi:hypothetical protein
MLRYFRGELLCIITQWIKGFMCTFRYYPMAQRLINERSWWSPKKTLALRLRANVRGGPPSERSVNECVLGNFGKSQWIWVYS